MTNGRYLAFKPHHAKKQQSTLQLRRRSISIIEVVTQCHGSILLDRHVPLDAVGNYVAVVDDTVGVTGSNCSFPSNSHGGSSLDRQVRIHASDVVRNASVDVGLVIVLRPKSPGPIRSRLRYKAASLFGRVNHRADGLFHVFITCHPKVGGVGGCSRWWYRRRGGCFGRRARGLQHLLWYLQRHRSRCRCLLVDGQS